MTTRDDTGLPATTFRSRGPTRTRSVRFYIGSSPGAHVDQEARARRIAELLAFHAIDGATILPAWGVWQGSIEASTVVEIIASLDPAESRFLADDLRALFGQESVLVVDALVESRLVERAQ